MTIYTAFGLTFESDFDLSPLATSNVLSADIQIEQGNISKLGIASPKKISHLANLLRMNYGYMFQILHGFMLQMEIK